MTGRCNMDRTLVQLRVRCCWNLDRTLVKNVTWRWVSPINSDRTRQVAKIALCNLSGSHQMLLQQRPNATATTTGRYFNNDRTLLQWEDRWAPTVEFKLSVTGRCCNNDRTLLQLWSDATTTSFTGYCNNAPDASGHPDQRVRSMRRKPHLVPNGSISFGGL
jgi:hypothetical protein